MRKQLFLALIALIFSLSGYSGTIKRIEAETCNEVSSGVRTETNSSLSGGGNVGYIKNGTWIKFNGFVFNEYDIRFNFATSGTAGGYIELRLGSSDGTLIGTVTVTGTSGWTDYKIVSSDIISTIGVHDLYLVFTGGDGYLFNIDYFEVYTNNPNAVNYSFLALAYADSAGFVESDIKGDSIEGGTEITLTAWGNYGYNFMKWIDGDGNDISSVNPFVFTITSDTIIKAQFEKGKILTQTPPNTCGFANTAGHGIETTTGGDGGYIVVVNTLAQFKAYATSLKPYVIIVNGHINADPWVQINVNSNKTIVGYGDDATLKNIELNLNQKQNIIIRNLIIRDSKVPEDITGKEYDYDAIQSDSSNHLWIDHCFLTNTNDGLIDLRYSTDNVTVSWNHLSINNKAFGIGWTSATNYSITIHHNWIDHTNQRNPSFGNGTGHLYNNYLSNISSYGNFARGDARNVIQNSYFYNLNDPLIYDTEAKLYSSGNEFQLCSGKNEGNVTEMPFNPADYYSYTLIPASEVKDSIISGTGPQWFVGNQYITLLPKNTLNTSVEGNGKLTPESGEFLANGYIHIKAIPVEGWKFNHWSGDISGNNADTAILLNTNITIKAHFIEERQLTITIKGNGKVTPESGNYIRGETIQLSAIPDNGWTFDYWSGDINGSSADTSIILNNNISVIAHFVEENSLNITRHNKDNKIFCNYNPEMKAIHIKTDKLDKINFSIYGLDGSKVLSGILLSSEVHEISVNNLNNGIYIIKLEMSHQSFTQRFIVY